MPANKGSPSPHPSRVCTCRLQATRGSPSILRFALPRLFVPSVATDRRGNRRRGKYRRCPTRVAIRRLFARHSVLLTRQSRSAFNALRHSRLPPPHSPIAIRGLSEAKGYARHASPFWGHT
jgi:hypothetical protein